MDQHPPACHFVVELHHHSIESLEPIAIDRLVDVISYKLRFCPVVMQCQESYLHVGLTSKGVHIRTVWALYIIEMARTSVMSIRRSPDGILFSLAYVYREISQWPHSYFCIGSH